MEGAFHDLVHTASLLLSGLIFLIISYGAYNVFIHPLRAYPGPLLWRAYRLPYIFSILSGKLPQDFAEFHRRYGPVVRVAPDELSYIDSRAWKDIYGFKNPTTDGFSEMLKDPLFTGKPMNGIPHILQANTETHGRYRRLLSHSFSDKGMREMQPRIQGHVDRLIDGLKRRCGEGWQDMAKWFNWTTFDMIGDLTYGESFHCLETETTHSWIEFVFGNVKAVVVINTLRRYGLDSLVPYLVPKRLVQARVENFRYGDEKIGRRIGLGTGRGDFWDNVLEKSKDGNAKGLSRDEMVSNSLIIILGGSETTATLLSGTIYLLLKHPKVMKKLNDEVRGAFKNEEQIDLMSVSKLDYMLAVLDEAMRYYPPVPDQTNRMVPEPGAMICGKWVPAGTSLQAQQWCSNHDERNFRRPNKFLPERWLGDPEFESDDRTARQPFSIGPRNCIGKNLAYAEMRLILAKVCWNFDMELDESRCANWLTGQKVFALWEKSPLWVKLTPAKRQ